jgi:hypothetical protein
MRKTGRSINEVSVICQDKISIVLKTITKLIPLEMIPLSVDVNACCAPITSPLTREINEPV